MVQPAPLSCARRRIRRSVGCKVLASVANTAITPPRRTASRAMASSIRYTGIGQHRVCFLCELTHSRAGAENSLCPVAAGDTRILQPPLAHPCYIPTSVHIAQNRVIQNMVHLYFRHLALYQLA